MSEWRRISQSSDVQEHEPLVIDLTDDESVLVTRIDGKLCACGNSCPHVGGPLGDGVIRHGQVVCPYHNATFSLVDGSVEKGPAIDDLPLYSIREEDGVVYLGAPQKPQIRMPDGDDDRTVLIVGAGAAASSCAETLRREGYSGAITMVTKEEYGPYNRPMLSKAVISGDAPIEASGLRDPEFYDRLQIELRTGDPVVSAHPGDRRVRTESGAELEGDMILFATGAEPKRLEVPGAELQNVFTLRTRADAQ